MSGANIWLSPRCILPVQARENDGNGFLFTGSAGSTVVGGIHATGNGLAGIRFDSVNDIRLADQGCDVSSTGNTGAGIEVAGTATGIGIGTPNLDIEDNTGIPIDLDGDGVTANNYPDTPSGPNNRLNFPVITDITWTGSVFQIDGIAACSGCRVYVSTTDTPHGSGHGAGTFFDQTTAGGDGSWQVFAASLDLWISAVVVDGSYNMSEFAQNFPRPSVCGNSVVEAGEACDDGDTDNGDGCNSLCFNETGCGNGTVEGTEQCDDGGNGGGDGCSASCMWEFTCGDNVLEVGEQCDDGNTVGGDGCGPTCALETNCGNGTVEFPESCDDSNRFSGDGCSAYCTAEPICGNGVVDFGEECDDFNGVDGDGCSSGCLNEFTTAGGLIDCNNGSPAYRGDGWSGLPAGVPLEWPIPLCSANGLGVTIDQFSVELVRPDQRIIRTLYSTSNRGTFVPPPLCEDEISCDNGVLTPGFGRLWSMIILNYRLTLSNGNGAVASYRMVWVDTPTAIARLQHVINKNLLAGHLLGSPQDPASDLYTVDFALRRAVRAARRGRSSWVV
ncbi:MAG: DUF4215 domain-containing protein, partial [Myxococcales bacterium]|nr:DUF4215 domain-containing protein [Myxococcales bacterium]